MLLTRLFFWGSLFFLQIICKELGRSSILTLFQEYASVFGSFIRHLISDYHSISIRSLCLCLDHDVCEMQVFVTNVKIKGGNFSGPFVTWQTARLASQEDNPTKSRRTGRELQNGFTIILVQATLVVSGQSLLIITTKKHKYCYKGSHETIL